jgi:DNA-binding CsgD family transcriptional regulator
MTVVAEKSLNKFLSADGELEKNVLQVETDIEAITEKLKFTEQLFPECVVMLCRATHRNFQYISENFTTFFGHSVAFYQRISSSDYFANVHPDDVQPLALCYDYLTAETSELNVEQLLSTRFVISYRFKHSEGHYIHVEDEKMVMESSRGKQVGLTLIRSVDATTRFSAVKIEVLKKLKGKFVKIGNYTPTQPRLISSRETDVLKLIKEGFKNTEIADRLSISVNTVKNHKKNLFRKMNVRNSFAVARID